MTIKELKELIANVDDDVIVMVKDDCGDYEVAQDGYEDIRDFWDFWGTRSSYLIREETQQKKVFCIY